MYIQNWSTEDWKKDSNIEKVKDENEKYFITEMLNDSENEMISLSSIEIETVNRCNNDCSFCPVNRNDDIRQLRYMDKALFEKIISDLEAINYSGVISLFSNNEPLIDKRILDFISFAKKKLPNATHALFTNGLLLNRDKYVVLTELLDFLVIDNYNDDLRLNPNVQEIYESSSDVYNGCKVLVQNRKKNQILLNRGTLSPNQEAQNTIYSSPCILPYIQMVVRPDGKVSRCCQDAYGNETMGDLNNQTVSEIWYGDKFNSLRREVHNGRNERKFCKNCDIIGLTNYFPDYWWGKYYSQLIKILRKIKEEKRKIVLFNYTDARQLITSLKMNGISVDYVVIEEPIEEYIRNDLYVVFDKYDAKEINILLQHGMQCVKNFIICEPIFPTGLVRNINEKQYYIDKITKASQDNCLMIWGAGETAKMLMGYYHIKPSVIVDNYKSGQLFAEKYEVQKIDNINAMDQFIVLIAASDYYPIVQQLRKRGVTANNIVIGINLI